MSGTSEDRERYSGKVTSFYISFAEKDALDAEAKRLGESRNSVLRRAIRLFVGLPD